MPSIAIGIVRAHDRDLRTLLIDAFADYFRAIDPTFDVAWFEKECRR